MMLLVRNKVKDVAHWKRVFDSQAESAQAAGVTLLNVWQSVDEANQVFFLFDLEDRARAEAYMASPEATAVGENAGVIDGEFHFLETLPSS